MSLRHGRVFASLALALAGCAGAEPVAPGPALAPAPAGGAAFVDAYRQAPVAAVAPVVAAGRVASIDPGGTAEQLVISVVVEVCAACDGRA